MLFITIYGSLSAFFLESIEVVNSQLQCSVPKKHFEFLKSVDFKDCPKFSVTDDPVTDTFSSIASKAFLCATVGDSLLQETKNSPVVILQETAVR